MTRIRETFKSRSTMSSSYPGRQELINESRAPDVATVPVGPAGLGAQTGERALATTIEPPPRETSGLRVIRAVSFRYDPEDGDVMVSTGRTEVAIDDPLALLAVTMAAIKFGHGLEMLAAAQKLVTDFGKEPTP